VEYKEKGENTMKIRKHFSVMAIIAILGVTVGFTVCDNGNGNNNGNGNGNGNNSEIWRISKRIITTFDTDGETIHSTMDEVYNYITYPYTNDTNYEEEYNLAQTSYYSPSSTTLTSTSYTHETRKGDTCIITGTTEETSRIITITYYPETDLRSKRTETSTRNSGETTTGGETYTIHLLNDSGGIKTYKYYLNSIINNGVSQDISAPGTYYEYKIQNGKTLEEKIYVDDVLSKTTTYTFPDNAIIRAKVPSWFKLQSVEQPSRPESNYYQTVEVLSDSATELVIRVKTFMIYYGLVTSYDDRTFEKVN
jgi:hypothetical protein